MPKHQPVFVYNSTAKTEFPDSLFCPSKASLSAKGYNYDRHVLLAALESGLYYDHPNKIVSTYFSYGRDGSTVTLWFRETLPGSNSSLTKYEFLGAQHNLKDESAVSLATISFHLSTNHTRWLVDEPALRNSTMIDLLNAALIEMDIVMSRQLI